MNKDAILASIIGFAIGLLITGVVIVGPRIVEKIQLAQSQGQVASASQDANKNQPSKEESISDTTELTIDNPKPETIVYTADLTVSGKRSKNQTIIITSPIEEVVVAPQNSATYEGKVTLKEGKNDITVASVAGGTATTRMVVVYYSRETE
jgi:hypothetical protein